MEATGEVATSGEVLVGDIHVESCLGRLITGAKFDRFDVRMVA